MTLLKTIHKSKFIGMTSRLSNPQVINLIVAVRFYPLREPILNGTPDHALRHRLRYRSGDRPTKTISFQFFVRLLPKPLPPIGEKKGKEMVLVGRVRSEIPKWLIGIITFFFYLSVTISPFLHELWCYARDKSSVRSLTRNASHWLSS